jgi:hypothetical protein
MAVNSSSIFLEKDGILVNQVEIRNPSDGSHCKVKLIGGKVIMRMLVGGSGTGPSIPVQAVLPGHEVRGSNGKARLILLLPPPKNGKIEASFPIFVTCSLNMAVSRRLRNILGDIVEEYAYWKLRRGKSRAKMWLTRQVLGSIGPIIWQIVRYDLRTGLNGWKVWGLSFPSRHIT